MTGPFRQNTRRKTWATLAIFLSYLSAKLSHVSEEKTQVGRAVSILSVNSRPHFSQAF